MMILGVEGRSRTMRIAGGGDLEPPSAWADGALPPARSPVSGFVASRKLDPNLLASCRNVVQEERSLQQLLDSVAWVIFKNEGRVSGGFF